MATVVEPRHSHPWTVALLVVSLLLGLFNLALSGMVIVANQNTFLYIQDVERHTKQVHRDLLDSQNRP